MQIGDDFSQEGTNQRAEQVPTAAFKEVSTLGNCITNTMHVLAYKRICCTISTNVTLAESVFTGRSCNTVFATNL